MAHDENPRPKGPQPQRAHLLEHYRRLRLQENFKGPRRRFLARRREGLERELDQRKSYFCLSRRRGRFPSSGDCQAFVDRAHRLCAQRHGPSLSRRLVGCVRARLK